MQEKILEVCTVTPPPGSPTDMCLPLTFFDLLWFREEPPEHLFFYETHLSERLFSDSVIPKLKHSLSITLQHFLPLAGNLEWTSSSPNPVIRYKEGDGVSLTVAVSDADFHHLSGKNIRECKIFRPLVPILVGSDSQVSVISFKITLFPNKGFCICNKAHHGILDGKSAALFMKSWASICKFGEDKKGMPPKLNPIFDRKHIREQYAEIENWYIEILKRNGFVQNSLAIRNTELLPDKVRGTFELSGSDVRNLKELIRARVSYVSTFNVTYAYVILCFLRVKEVTKQNRVVIGFPMDLRARLEPHIPENYFGNCVAFVNTILDTKELLGTEGMEVIVNSITKMIKGLESGVVKGIKQRLSNPIVTMDDINKTMMIFVVGSSKLGFEHIDFGWGRPRKTDLTSVDKFPVVMFTESEDGGIEVELSLSKCEMESFSSAFVQGLEEMMIKHK